MYIFLKKIILSLFKLVGITALMRKTNQNKIPILCYHGISVSDAHKFMPSNFMPFETFKKRILWLKKNNYQFLGLDQATDELSKGKMDHNKSIVITIDDGFAPCFDQMIPFLEENKIPATFYITTFYTTKKFPIFRIAFQYLRWKYQHNYSLNSLKKYNDPYFDNLTIRNENAWEFINYCENNYNSEQCNNILVAIENENNITIDDKTRRSFTLIQIEELKNLKFKYIDFQLHTHTHECNDDQFKFKNNLKKNMNLLSEINPNSLVHFCYPSGIWSEKLFPVMQNLKIKTATTCDPGLADQSSSLYKLPRILDSTAMDLIQFEAEIVGIGDLLRSIK